MTICTCDVIEREWQNNAVHTEPPTARFANGECSPAAR